MGTYSEYPVFEPNQVLSYTHLNGLVDYLEKQDRHTRRKLIGIGIACGLKVNWKTSEEVLYISKGVAVTSAGYLIGLEEDFYDKFLPYSLPKASMEESGDGEIADHPYPFFQDTNGEEIDMWELLPTAYVPEEGEAAPNQLTESFLEEKVILLYLETERESMRNCDINDCSDKGAKMTFDVRVLAIHESDAIEIFNQEEEIANRPVHQNRHPKFDLQTLNIEKINPSRYQLKNFQEIYLRISAILAKVNPALTAALTDSFEAYRYLLTEVYPEVDFPSGPFSDLDSHFAHVSHDFSQNILSLQYLYDFYYDLVQGYKEFIHYAHQLVAECCPHEGRFPKHVLLGKVLRGSSAFIPSSFGDSFDPFSAQTGLAPPAKPFEYRHYFIPSMIFGGQRELLEKVRSLHYRLYLSAFRYDTDKLQSLEIRITPSKDGDYFLSDKAVPFYYAFNHADDFHANWSYDKTIRNKLDQVFSYPFIQNPDHPLLNKMDDHNFYRIEGHVGKGLATVLKNLSAQKKSLGLSFSIEPVFIGITGNEEFDDQARRELLLAARRLFMCKMRDLDVIFLILIALLFHMLFVLLTYLSKIRTASYGLQRITNSNITTEANESSFSGSSAADFINKKIVREDSELVLDKIRKTKGYLKGTVVNKISKDPQEPVLGNLYLEINADSHGSNLYNRTLNAVKGKAENNADPQKIAEEIYPTVALMDSTEEMMKSLSSETLSDFDFELFENRYGSFVDTYKNFVNQRASPVLEQHDSYRQAKKYAEQNQGQLATNDTQSLLGNMSSEFNRRFRSMLAELTLPGYSKKNPGLEHKAGVPKGGTFIPIYAHRDFVTEELRKLKEDLERDDLVINNLATRGLSHATGNFNFSFTTRASLEAVPNRAAANFLVNAVANSDPLDNFIVLGDFCISHQCCDGDCSDLFEEEVDQIKGTVTGRVIDARSGGIVRQAKITAVNVSTNKESETVVDGKGNYTMELEPAGYRISAMATGYSMDSATITVQAGQSINLSFALQKSTFGTIRVPEIIDGTAGYEVDSDLGREALGYYGARYAYYNAYGLKLNAEAATAPEKKAADQVKSSLDMIMSRETDLIKLNREIKRISTSLVKSLETLKNEEAKLKVNESIRVINSAYLDKLALISPESLSTATKNTMNEVEKITKSSKSSLSKSIKEWTRGHNLSSKPKIVEELGKLKITKGKDHGDQ